MLEISVRRFPLIHSEARSVPPLDLLYLIIPQLAVKSYVSAGVNSRWTVTAEKSVYSKNFLHLTDTQRWQWFLLWCFCYIVKLYEYPTVLSTLPGHEQPRWNTLPELLHCSWWQQNLAMLVGLRSTPWLPVLQPSHQCKQLSWGSRKTNLFWECMRNCEMLLEDSQASCFYASCCLIRRKAGNRFNCNSGEPVSTGLTDFT